MVDDDVYELLSIHKWHYNANGYAGRWVGGRKDKKYHYMHRMLMAYPTARVDHINGDKLDNRRQNLRTATHRENLRNRGATKANKFGTKCIYWDGPRQKWAVRVNVEGKLAYLGRYAELEAAIQSRDSFLKKYHGEFFKV